MRAQSSDYFFLNWAKERIDEMDAALASLESNVADIRPESRVKARSVIAELKKIRMTSNILSRSKPRPRRAPSGSRLSPRCHSDAIK